jgi:glycosyltransferase involved in cell wall biosynthesis
MKISVIICTHNPREEYLRRVLEGLRAQTLPLPQWELLLIDNSSGKSLAEHFDLSWHPHARHIREDELGLTPARLRGIHESRAEILIFDDDDTVLAPDYLAQALKVAEMWPFVGVWGGNVIPEFEKPLPSWVGDQIWRLTVVELKEDVWSNLREGFITIPAGAGMCVRKNVGLRFVEWCEQKTNQKIMDRTGSLLTGYGDVAIAHCALDLGLGTGKSMCLRLTHLIPAARLTLDYFVRHAEGDAASLLLFRASRGLPIQKPKPATLINSLRWLVHRIIHRIPREQCEIQKAYQRGLQKGYQLAMNQIDQTQFVRKKLASKNALQK